MSSPQAFDSLAAAYDQTFSQSQIARWLRGRVHARLANYWHEGQSVLELGSGTGEDTLHLGGRGIHVTATDVSDAMLDIARQKTQELSNVTFERLDLRDLPDDKLLGPYDGVFANFGVVNCIGDWSQLAQWLAKRVKPGGIVAFGVMSRFCLWESAWHLLHLQPRTAFRRWDGVSTFQPDPTQPAIKIYYPLVRRLRKDFHNEFRQKSLTPMGFFLPPSDAFGVVEKRPRLFALLTEMEELAMQRPIFASFADHYWIEFERLP